MSAQRSRARKRRGSVASATENPENPGERRAVLSVAPPGVRRPAGRGRHVDAREREPLGAAPREPQHDARRDPAHAGRRVHDAALRFAREPEARGRANARVAQPRMLVTAGNLTGLVDAPSARPRRAPPRSARPPALARVPHGRGPQAHRAAPPAPRGPLRRAARGPRPGRPPRAAAAPRKAPRCPREAPPDKA